MSHFGELAQFTETKQKKSVEELRSLLVWRLEMPLPVITSFTLCGCLTALDSGIFLVIEICLNAAISRESIGQDVTADVMVDACLLDFSPAL